jgi:hypothetical protein
VYLEAMLGKDVTGKRDDAVKRTSTEAAKPKRWFFGIFGRSADAPVPRIKNATTNSGDETASGSGAKSDTNASPTPDPSTGDNAKQGDVAPGQPSPPKDDAIQKAKADESQRPRRGLFGLLRGSDEP